MKLRPGVAWYLFASASKVQRKRALLTIAAIGWGSLALLMLLSFGKGLERQLLKGRLGLGENLAIIWPGETGHPWHGLPAGRPIRPRVEDIGLLRERIPDAAGVLGEMRIWQASFTFGKKTVNGRVTGTYPVYERMRNQIPREGGRFINARDLQQRRRVIFFGNELARDVFGERDPVGLTVLVNRVPYIVVGVMKKKMQMGTYGGPDAENSVIPITTFKAQFGMDRLENIVLQPDAPERMQAVLGEMRRILGAKYGFDPEDDEVFGVWDTLESTRMIEEMMIGIQIFLGIIGGLTLTVGGVGVANIMYAVVKQRTREIGVLMALGARRSWVIASILLDGITFTLAGGAIGITMAVGAIVLIGMIPLENNEALEFLGKPTLSLSVGIAVAGLLGVIGVVAAYFPARRAASINPAETLRYE